MQIKTNDQLEQDLLQKLFSSYHLNVEERKNLPNGKIRASIVRAMIQRSLNEHQWFPGEKQNPIGDAGGEYIQIGLEQGKVSLHINYESSYLRFSHMDNQYNSILEASDAFLAEKQRRNDLDGIEIDWDS